MTAMVQLGRAHTESTRHESTIMSHETHRLSVRGSMDTPMRERRITWGRGEGETLSVHVVWTQCALGLSLLPSSNFVDLRRTRRSPDKSCVSQLHTIFFRHIPCLWQQRYSPNFVISSNLHHRKAQKLLCR